MVNADLDGKVTYLGMDVSPTPVEAGKDVRLTHYWKVNVAPGEGWKMFTHISGTNRQGFANVDHTPGQRQVPGGQVEGWPDHSRPAQLPSAGRLDLRSPRGLHRALQGPGAHGREVRPQG